MTSNNLIKNASDNKNDELINKPRGFTITELLVVMVITSIIFVIISIISVSFSSILSKTETAIDVNDERSLSQQILEKVIDEANSTGEELVIVEGSDDVLYTLKIGDVEKIVIKQLDEKIVFTYNENDYEFKHLSGVNFIVTSENSKLLTINFTISEKEVIKKYNMVVSMQPTPTV